LENPGLSNPRIPVEIVNELRVNFDLARNLGKKKGKARECPSV
jgi:hypothetical protein